MSKEKTNNLIEDIGGFLPPFCIGFVIGLMTYAIIVWRIKGSSCVA